MKRRPHPIPTLRLTDDPALDIGVARIADDDRPLREHAGKSHRHDFHFFLLQERGSMVMEVDFERYRLGKSSLLYLHPGQVHRVASLKNATASILAIASEKLDAGSLQALEALQPLRPLRLPARSLAPVLQLIDVCLQLGEGPRRPAFEAARASCCNALAALFVAEYAAAAPPGERLSRPEQITRAFRSAVNASFAVSKRPADYARMLNLSVPYLNECVKDTTGHSASELIRQRLVLEAKRLLCHSDQSVKEIAARLGYDDAAYFSRLFNTACGMSASAFRHKNRG